MYLLFSPLCLLNHSFEELKNAVTCNLFLKKIYIFLVYNIPVIQLLFYYFISLKLFVHFPPKPLFKLKEKLHPLKKNLFVSILSLAITGIQGIQVKPLYIIVFFDILVKKPATRKFRS